MNRRYNLSPASVAWIDAEAERTGESASRVVDGAIRGAVERQRRATVDAAFAGAEAPLPCPWCGLAPTVKRGDGYAAVTCRNEDCPCEESPQAIGDDEAHAVRLWNTRA